MKKFYAKLRKIKKVFKKSGMLNFRVDLGNVPGWSSRKKKKVIFSTILKLNFSLFKNIFK